MILILYSLSSRRSNSRDRQVLRTNQKSFGSSSYFLVNSRQFHPEASSWRKSITPMSIWAPELSASTRWKKTGPKKLLCLTFWPSFDACWLCPFRNQVWTTKRESYLWSRTKNTPSERNWWRTCMVARPREPRKMSQVVLRTEASCNRPPTTPCLHSKRPKRKVLSDCNRLPCNLIIV